MPGMTAMPILPSAAPPASSTPLPSGLAARADKVSNSSPALNATSSGSEAGAAPNDNSFASILKRQLAQATPAPPAGTTVVSDANDKVLQDISLVIDADAQVLLDTAVVIDVKAKALADTAAAKVLADSTVAKALADKTVNTDANAKTLAESVTVLDIDAKTLAPTAPIAALKEIGRSTKSDDKASQDKSDDGLNAQSPYLLGLAASPGVKIEVNSGNLVTTEEKPAAANDGALPLAVSVPVESRHADTQDAPPAKLAEMSQAAANKTAEFAAASSSTLEATVVQGPQKESTNIGSSFDNLLAAAQAVNQGRSTHAPSHTGPSLPVQTPVGARGWDGEVSDKLVWMVGRQEQRAELVLNPPQLGRIEVSLSIIEGQTTASFVSANPAVRDALEAALPRLREILADAGVSLGQAQVGADAGSTANQSANNRENWDNSRRIANNYDLANGMDLLSPIETKQWIRQSNSLVDVFA